MFTLSLHRGRAPIARQALLLKKPCRTRWIVRTNQKRRRIDWNSTDLRGTMRYRQSDPRKLDGNPHDADASPTQLWSWIDSRKKDVSTRMASHRRPISRRVKSGHSIPSIRGGGPTGTVHSTVRVRRRTLVAKERRTQAILDEYRLAAVSAECGDAGPSASEQPGRRALPTSSAIIRERPGARPPRSWRIVNSPFFGLRSGRSTSIPQASRGSRNEVPERASSLRPEDWTSSWTGSSLRTDSARRGDVEALDRVRHVGQRLSPRRKWGPG